MHSHKSFNFRSSYYSGKFVAMLGIDSRVSLRDPHGPRVAAAQQENSPALAAIPAWDGPKHEHKQPQRALKLLS